MKIDDVLVVEQKSKDNYIKLIASDEGRLYLSMSGSWYEVADSEVQYMSGIGFIACYVEGNKGTKFFVALGFSKIPDVMEYLSHWCYEELEKLKNRKVESFKAYLNYCLDYVAKNVDVENLRPTYKTEYIDNRYYGGGVFTYVHIYLSYGESWDDDYDKTYYLTEELTSQLIDRKMNGEDDYNWFGDIIVRFRPTADNREDFIKKPTFEAIQDWESDCLVTVDKLMLSLKSGMGTGGSGYYSDGLCKTDIPVDAYKLDKRFTHVIWYGK